MTINPNRPIEELRGSNRGIVRQILGRVHCCSSRLTAARAARPRNFRKVPVELRRGWAKCVIDTMAEYRVTFDYVMSGGHGFTE
jgi:hypothetical protein